MRWKGHISRREETHAERQTRKLEVHGRRKEEQLKRKVWIAWVREGARQNGTEEIIQQGEMERAHP